MAIRIRLFVSKREDFFRHSSFTIDTNFDGLACDLVFTFVFFVLVIVFTFEIVIFMQVSNYVR